MGNPPPVPVAEKTLDVGRVLIVDDEMPVRKLFRMILAQDMPSLVVNEACNGLEGVRAFREFRHGVVALDLRMPLLDGLETFASIKKICEEDGSPMPSVIFCTGFIPSDAMNDIVTGGAGHQLLQKPVRSAEIIKAVRNGIKSATQSGA